jgi:hypothetical protein
MDAAGRSENIEYRTLWRFVRLVYVMYRSWQQRWRLRIANSQYLRELERKHMVNRDGANADRSERNLPARRVM